MSSERPTHSERKRRFTQEAVLDAAEGLIEANESSDFSLRELAEATGMAVTTLLAHFGSKGGVLQGLMGRLLDRVAADYRHRLGDERDADSRVLLMMKTGSDVILERPRFSRLVCGSLLTVREDHAFDSLRERTEDLWRLALADVESRTDGTSTFLCGYLPEQLSVTFRGALSIWIAENLADEEFRRMLSNGVLTLLACFAEGGERQRLLAALVPEKAV